MNIFYFPAVPAALAPSVMRRSTPSELASGENAYQSATAKCGIPLMCDAHIRKITLECVQMLYTWAWQQPALANWIMGDEDRYACAYRPTHEDHPLVEWLCEAEANVSWLMDYTALMLIYYRDITGRHHKCRHYHTQLIHTVSFVYPNFLLKGPITTLPMCVPEQYHVCLRGTGAVNPQLSYVNYYVNEKLNQPWCQFNYDRPGKLAILAIWERYRQRFAR